MFKFERNVDLSGYSLIIPSVSVGNVGQLVADLLIYNLKMQKVASLWSPAIVPVIGSDPFNLQCKSLMVSSELFVDEKEKNAVLHFRSTLSKQHAKEFMISLMDAIIGFNISKIVIISSSFAHERHDISTVPFRYLLNDYFPSERSDFEKLEWIPHDSDLSNVIHGGGFAKRLLDVCTDKKFPCLVLFKYCSEGDNAPDAMETLQYLNQWAKLIPAECEDVSVIKVPPSWNLPFGGPPPLEIY